MNPRCAISLQRGLAFGLVLALLFSEGLALLHHHDGDHREIPPGYAWTGPNCHGHPDQTHLDARREPSSQCHLCALLLQGARHGQPWASAPAKAAPAPAEAAPSDAPAVAGFRLPSSGRAPPSC